MNRELPTALPESPGTHRLSPQAFERFAQFITRELGIRMAPDKIPMLQGRLLRRLRALNLQSLEDYQQILFSSDGPGEELTQFIDAVTTNKTDFFREPTHFRFLVDQALPSLEPRAAAPPDGRLPPRSGSAPWNLRLWCAGCSSGEEPYTLAMVLSEFATQHPGFDFSILGTDISSRVLQQAALAIYPEERIHPIDPNLRRKYLLRSRDPTRHLVRVVPALRQRTRFQRLNFMAPAYPVQGTFEVIFFRNVMIYFAKATQESVIHRLAEFLVPGGYLFVGHSETLAGLRIPVRQVGPAIYRKPP